MPLPTASVARSPARSSRGVRNASWVAQITLALILGIGWGAESGAVLTDLARQVVWPGAVPPFSVRPIGTAKALGTVGLVFPTVLRGRPWLTPLVAVGPEKERGQGHDRGLVPGALGAILFNVVLGSSAALIAWGRFTWARIRA